MTATKSLIENKFIELLATQPITQIGVKELTTACGINRNTFYYYYKNIPDLIESVVHNSVDEILAEHPPTYDSIEDCLTTAINFAQHHKRAIYHIYNSTNRAIFERYLWKICDYTIHSFLDSFPNTSKHAPNAEQREVIYHLLRYEFFGFIIDWIGHDMPGDVMDKVGILSSYLKSIIKI